jgi:hypothetical protein
VDHQAVQVVGGGEEIADPLAADALLEGLQLGAALPLFH